METMYFEVVSIDGDYANLKRTDAPSDDLRVVARALCQRRLMRAAGLDMRCSSICWRSKWIYI